MKARKKGTNDPFEEIDCIQFKDRYIALRIVRIALYVYGGNEL